ncbi:MAG: peptide deformylase [Bacteroidota bacterium]|nr:peptide deformylase [Bacteroidota bacterium]
MTLPIYIIGSKVLRKTAVDFELKDPEADKLIDNLYETMGKADGLGLAAPQAGVSKRLFVIDATSLAGDYPELADFRKEFINAKIIERSQETETSNEGCLSIPGIHEDVERSSKIRIQYYDRNWEFHDETFEGISAIVMQHEHDHLDGILFTDKVSPLRKRLLKKKLQKISKGTFSKRYKYVLGR